MAEDDVVDRLLADLTVIEVSRTLAGAYAGKLFADAGASTIMVEGASGHPLRRTWRDDEGWVESPFFAYLSAGKQSAVADLSRLSELARAADILLLESDDTIDATLLEKLARCAVVVAITPWGLGGAWAGQGRPWTQFTIQAEGGSLAMRGDPDKPGLTTGSHEDAWVAACAAAAGGLAALSRLRSDTRGEVVDVPLLASTVYSTNLFASLSAVLRGVSRDPAPNRRRILPSVEPAKDGWVGFNLASARNHEDFLVLIERPDFLADEQMRSFIGRYERSDEWNAAVHAWTTQHTVADIVERAREFRIPTSPVHNGQTILDDEQVVARGLYVRDATATFQHPVSPYLVNGRRPRIGRPAPAIDEAHIPVEELPSKELQPGSIDFGQLRVLDLGSWWAGPVVSTMLGSLGADVLKVEATQRIDGARSMGGMVTTEDRWWEFSPAYLYINHNKRGITLDFSREEGRELLRQLIKTADVIVENFAPRVLPGIGLTWEAIHALNPRLIMLRMPAFGLTGPRQDMVGFAQTVEQYSGMCWATGYTDGPPVNPGAPADPMAGFGATFALLSALRQRARTGEGMLVEAPLAEAALVMTSEQVIEWTKAHHLIQRDGNHARTCAPQGVYGGRGVEQWLAVSVATDDQWKALRDYVGLPRWAGDEELDSHAGRRRQRYRLDQELQDWMTDRVVDDVVAALVAVGVPAAKVADPRFVHETAAVRGTGLYEDVNHPVAGRVPAPILPFHLTGAGSWSRLAPPVLGQDNDQVFRHELRLSPARIEDLLANDIIGSRPTRL